MAILDEHNKLSSKADLSKLIGLPTVPRTRSVSIPSSRQFGCYPNVWAVSTVCCSQRSCITVLHFSTSVILQFLSTANFHFPLCRTRLLGCSQINFVTVYMIVLFMCIDFGQNTEGPEFTIIAEYCHILAYQNMHFLFIN
jgi:hypothetical protein